MAGRGNRPIPMVTAEDEFTHTVFSEVNCKLDHYPRSTTPQLLAAQLSANQSSSYFYLHYNLRLQQTKQAIRPRTFDIALSIMIAMALETLSPRIKRPAKPGTNLCHPRDQTDLEMAHISCRISIC